jgi:hypothetical protein
MERPLPSRRLHTWHTTRCPLAGVGFLRVPILSGQSVLQRTDGRRHDTTRHDRPTLGQVSTSCYVWRSAWSSFLTKFRDDYHALGSVMPSSCRRRSGPARMWLATQNHQRRLCRQSKFRLVHHSATRQQSVCTSLRRTSTWSSTSEVGSRPPTV